jgi:hypothetical protein
MTAIDQRRFGAALDGLDGSPASLANAVRGVLIHRDWAPVLGVEFGADRLADQHIRPVGEILTRVLELQDDPIAINRALSDRMVGVCRHYAVLYAALLRREGIPARARAGFGRYFNSGWSDHWITERWEGRWVRDDAQIGPAAHTALGLTFDASDQPPGEFLTGAEAWLLCRAGGADPQEFGIFDMHGLWFVLGDLRLDLAALNKVELLPWDRWGGDHGPEWEPTDAELEAIDDLARVIVSDERTEIRERYEGLRVPPRIVSIVDGALGPVDLGALIEVGGERERTA